MIEVKEVDEVEAYEGAWMNLYIFRTGRHNGVGRYASKEAASDNIRGVKYTIPELKARDMTTPDGHRWRDLITVFPIPVKE